MAAIHHGLVLFGQCWEREKPGGRRRFRFPPAGGLTAHHAQVAPFGAELTGAAARFLK